jgi:diguanylate cyclase (GGDEF)-like protein/PAS domain S-box-containing protein
LDKTPRNLALFGILLASTNSWLPLAALRFSSLTLEQALHIAATTSIFAGVIYPISIVLLGGFLTSEQRRAGDVSELRTLNMALSLDAARSEGVFERTGVAMVWNDLGRGQIIRANPQFAGFTGYSEAELDGKRYEELSVPEDRERDLDTLRPFMAGDVASVSDERRYLRKDGTVVWGMRSITAIWEGESWHAFAIVQDITERKRAHDEIAYLASHDSLTNLFNRQVFLSELAKAIERRRPLELIAVLYIDLDDFKEINDRFGHRVGDATLAEVARRLRDCTANDGIVARIGGDEFAILQKVAISSGEISELAEKIINRVKEPFAQGADVAKTEVSVGIALGPRDGLDSEELIKRADIALYIAKAVDGSAYRFFEPEMEERTIARQVLKVDLAAALVNGELEVDYQPIIDLRLGGVTSFRSAASLASPAKGQDSAL